MKCTESSLQVSTLFLNIIYILKKGLICVCWTCFQSNNRLVFGERCLISCRSDAVGSDFQSGCGQWCEIERLVKLSELQKRFAEAFWFSLTLASFFERGARCLCSDVTWPPSALCRMFCYYLLLRSYYAITDYKRWLLNNLCKRKF